MNIVVIIHAHLQVKPDQEESFLSDVKTLLHETRAETGNISYDLLKSTEQEHHYTMVELWEDLQATASHNASPHFTTFLQQAKAYLAAPMDLKIFNGEAVQR